jgi:chaperonin GroES
MAVDLFDTQGVAAQKQRITHTGPGGCETPGATVAVAASIPRLRPLADRVLVRVLPEKNDENLIQLPDSAKEKPQEGEVLAVGNGRIVNGERIHIDVKVGQRIMFGKYSGNEVQVAGERLLLLQENELQGVYEE